MGAPCAPLIELLRSQEPDIGRIIPVFIARFNAAYGDPCAVRWDISADEWQRYEFLGDRVLNLVIAQNLFSQRDAVLDEGEMTAILSEIVSNTSLDAMMRGCDATHLLIPAVIGNQQCYGERITAGAFEAFIGALYCETGFDEVAYFVNTLFAPVLAGRQPSANVIGALQEYFQKRKEPVPVYRESDRSGPDHRPWFVVTVSLPDGREYTGEGTSLAGAKKAAAQAAFEALEPGA